MRCTGILPIGVPISTNGFRHHVRERAASLRRRELQWLKWSKIMEIKGKFFDFKQEEPSKAKEAAKWARRIGAPIYIEAL